MPSHAARGSVYEMFRRASQNQIYFLVLVAFIFFLAYPHIFLPQPLRSTSHNEQGGSDQHLQDISPTGRATNSTLGFQKILALSTAPSWRTRGLLAAAIHNGIDIDIPNHPVVTTELAEAFRRIGPGGKNEHNYPPLGSAKAWLAHLDMLKFVVSSNFDTALIIEDDVDWDVAIKDQTRLISGAVRQFTNVSASDLAPYGHDWDILWIGHCGEHTDADTPRVEFEDQTSPIKANYTGWADKYMKHLGERNRAIQRGINPVCSFGYAVTQAGAQNVLQWAGKGQGEAYDIRLMSGCKSHDLNCITVTPEIMHHYTPLHDSGYMSLVDEEDGKGSAANEAQFETVMGGTENIRNSARCKVLFGKTCLKRFREMY